MDNQFYLGDYHFIGDVKLQFALASYWYYTILSNNEFAGEVCFRHAGDGSIMVSNFYAIADELLTILILKYGYPHLLARSEHRLSLERDLYGNHIVDWQ